MLFSNELFLTKIYTKEIIKLVNKILSIQQLILRWRIGRKFVKICARKLFINIDLSKIKTGKIFKWLKKKNFR